MNSATIGGAVAFLLTVCVFSYLIGDNPFYRLALYLFLGVASAYATVVVLQSVFIPQALALVDKAGTGDWTTVVLLAVPWVLGLLLLLRASRSLAPVGNLAIAIMVGAGGALAVGGALLGTLIPQVQASWGEARGGGNALDNLLIWCPSVLGTVSVMLYFMYVGRKTPGGRGERHPLMRPAAWLGQGFLSVALAALYAGAVAAYLAVFVERAGFFYQALVNLFKTVNINIG
jgi:hypothetical protein